MFTFKLELQFVNLRNAPPLHISKGLLLKTRMTTVGILGGGISGLSMAHFLSKAPATKIKKIILYEGSDRLGGWMSSTRLKDGTLFEHGARTVRPIGIPAQTTLRMVEDIGLQDAVLSLPRSHPAAKNRLVFVDGQINRLPNSLIDLIKIRKPFSERLLKRFIYEIFTPPSKMEDESVHDFFSRRFGDQVARYMVDAMCVGIFAGDSKKLSIRSCFNALHEMERINGSVVKSMLLPGALPPQVPPVDSALSERAKREKWAVWSLRGGLESLPLKIESQLRLDNRVDIRKGHKVTKLNFMGAKTEVETDYGADDVGHVVSTIYASHLASILPDPLAELQKVLRSIDAVTVAVLNIEFDGSVLKDPGFGYLVPPAENSQLLGVIFDSCLFPEHSAKHRETTRLTCMLGGAFFQRSFGDPDKVSEETLVQAALQGLRQHLGIVSKPLRYILKVHKNCIPQYYLGHHLKIATMRDLIRKDNLPLTLVGSSYDGVAINDCVHSAKLAADKLWHNEL